MASLKMLHKEPQDTSEIPGSPPNPSRHLLSASLFSLAIVALLSLAALVLFLRFSGEQSRAGNLLGLAGAQSILVQRASLNTLEYLSTSSAEVKDLAAKDLVTLEENEKSLLSGHYDNINSGRSSSLSMQIQGMYFNPPEDAIRKLAEFRSLVSQSLAQNPQDLSPEKITVLINEILTLAKNDLVESMSVIARQISLENQQRIRNAKAVYSAIFALICVIIIGVVFFVLCPMHKRIEAYSDHIKKDADFDPLSGLLNRRSFALLASSALASTQRYDKSMSVISFDIDFFKSINDTYGHLAGDLAIRHISKILKENARSSDLVSRFGGEEFIVLLTETSAKDALLAAEKIRQAVASSEFTYRGNKISLTVSGGVSSIEAHENNMEGLLSRADKALYQAKSSGRNKIAPYKHPNQNYLSRQLWAKAQVKNLRTA